MNFLFFNLYCTKFAVIVKKHVSFLIVNSWATIKHVKSGSFNTDMLYEIAVLLLNLDKQAFYFLI